MTIVTAQREADEFVAVTITPIDSDEPILTGIEVATTTRTDRPTSWAPAVPLGDEVGLLTGDLPPGRHHIWARVTAVPETIVIEVGIVVIA